MNEHTTGAIFSPNLRRRILEALKNNRKDATIAEMASEILNGNITPHQALSIPAYAEAVYQHARNELDKARGREPRTETDSAPPDSPIGAENRTAVQEPPAQDTLDNLFPGVASLDEVPDIGIDNTLPPRSIRERGQDLAGSHGASEHFSAARPPRTSKTRANP
ncbi:hypothetical protein [Sciscionella marina]|uniref:hypothetical protein n=1 Tax=Sciscionella marina TaxID=508770 RepID=UPI0003717447|nr:hypothetical protein [Sciscionella marina]